MDPNTPNPDPVPDPERTPDDLGFGSSEAGKKGGKARARRLTKEQRAEIARKAGKARWAKETGREDELPKAVCGGEEPLHLGKIDVPCYVLEDERRVITLRGMQIALGMSPSGGAPRMATLARAIALNPSQGNDLAVRLESPIEFVMPQGGIAHGYEGILLVNICETILDARRAGKIGPRYEHIAQAAEIVLGAFASVGIVALIDEATGYQKFRRRFALAELLDKYIDDRLNVWTKTFPDEFYVELFRLMGWDYVNLRAGDGKPGAVGDFTREYVYRRMAPGIVQELEKSNPTIVPGRRMYKHHQWLTREMGHPALKEHLAKVITVMKLSPDWLTFKRNLNLILPLPGDQRFFDEFFKDDDKGDAQKR
jgi:hypothetical protein